MAEEQSATSSDQEESNSKQRCCTRVFHWLMWISLVCYAMSRFVTCDVSTSLPEQIPFVFIDMRRSPYGLSRKWDLTDHEWKECRRFVLKAWPWLILHSVVARALGYVVPSFVPHYHVAYSLLFVSLKLGLQSAAIFVFEHTVFFALAWLRLPVLTYAVAFFMVSHFDLFGYDFFRIVLVRHGYNSYFVTVVAFYWTVLRCLSFCMDCNSHSEDEAVGNRRGRRHLLSYWKTLSYAIYLPPLYLGPLQNYEDFLSSEEQQKPALTLRELVACGTGLLRSAVHFLFMDLMCHYFYSSALNKAPHLVARLDLTSLVGHGLALNMLFFMKYRIQYGLSGSVAMIEGHRLPAPPKCVFRSYLCSHFWRYLDHGLHLWIKKYIYLPIVGTQRKAHRKLLAVAMAFTSVWVWHGMTTAVTFWASLSFLGIALEVLLAQARRLDCLKNFESKHMNPVRRRFIKAVLGSPHYLLTIFACMFYLADMTVTTMFFKRVILGFPLPLVPVLVALYFGAHASQDAMDFEASGATRETAPGRTLPVTKHSKVHPVEAL
uniref:Acyltransferase required for palmitoylation of hedgehog hh family of secreted signaling n=1 Tax=Amblyomma maculatum TaxID=34609 RepID=G3MSB5_AMBMU